MDSPPKGLVPATPALAAALACRLSAEHRREIAQTAGLPPGEALLFSLAASREAYAFVPDGHAPVFMMGVEETGALTGSAMLWMLASGAIRRYAAGTVRTARWGVGRALRTGRADCLEQYIPEWYDTGLRFALRLGFRIAPETHRGRGGVALLRVVLERKDTEWEF